MQLVEQEPILADREMVVLVNYSQVLLPMVQIQVIVQHQHPVKVISAVVREVVHITVLLHQLLVAQGVLEAMRELSRQYPRYG